MDAWSTALTAHGGVNHISAQIVYYAEIVRRRVKIMVLLSLHAFTDTRITDTAVCTVDILLNQGIAHLI